MFLNKTWQNSPKSKPFLKIVILMKSCREHDPFTIKSWTSQLQRPSQTVLRSKFYLGTKDLGIFISAPNYAMKLIDMIKNRRRRVLELTSYSKLKIKCRQVQLPRSIWWFFWLKLTCSNKVNQWQIPESQMPTQPQLSVISLVL